MAVSGAPPDYYVVLQVQPDADAEVIEAAYRQLMKKYHPDVAGEDPAAMARHHQRAKAINEAYGVLREPGRRRQYDAVRTVAGTRPTPQSGTGEPPRARAPHSTYTPYTGPPPSPAEMIDLQDEVAGPASPWAAPFTLLSAAYYLLPGPYEWENDRKGEWLVALMLPVVGVVGFALATGRLALLIGQSTGANLFAWGMIGLMSLPLLRALPRVALAAGPSLVLLNSAAVAVVNQAHVPTWLAWVLLGLVSLVLSARLYVFSVLPMLGVCWLLSRFS